jgi:electron transfer flavoprotein alpha subunit
LKKAKAARILRVSNSHLLLPEDQIGLRGSPTSVVRILKSAEKGRRGEFYSDSLSGAEAIACIIRMYQAGVPEKKDRRRTETGYVVSSVKDDSGGGRRTYGETVSAGGLVGFWDADSARQKSGLRDPKKSAGLHGVCVFEKDKDSLRAGEELLYNCTKNGCEALRIVVRDAAVCDDLREAVEIAAFIRTLHLRSLAFPATITGRTIGPMVAALIGLGITADCTGLRYLEDGSVLQIRPAFGEAVLAEIKTKTFPQMFTVRPGVYALPEDERNHGLRTAEVLVTPGSRVRQILRSEMKNTGLLEARGIVAGGKACGKAGFGVLSELAEALGFALGGSRSAVAEGYVPYELQIGQTGVTVRPRIYLAFGISGAVQHMAGMRDSDFIVAVNTDRKARIFGFADICIAADWKDTAVALMQRVDSCPSSGL